MTDRDIRAAIAADPDAAPELTDAQIRRMRVVYPPRAIRKLRQKLNLKREELAAIIGVHPDTVTRWERGRSKPKHSVHNFLLLLERDPGALRWMGRAA